MKLLPALCAFSLLSLVSAIELPLEASFDGIHFAPFGSIEGDLKAVAGSLSLSRSEFALNEKQQDQLRTLASGDGFFAVRIKSSGSSGSLGASVRAACLFQSGLLKELISLQGDDKGRLLSFNYALDHPYDGCMATDNDVNFPSEVDVSFKFPSAGPMVIRIDEFYVALDHPYDGCMATDNDVNFLSEVDVTFKFPSAGPMVIRIDEFYVALDHLNDGCMATDNDVNFPSEVDVTFKFPSAGPMVVRIDEFYVALDHLNDGCMPINNDVNVPSEVDVTFKFPSAGPMVIRIDEFYVALDHPYDGCMATDNDVNFPSVVDVSFEFPSAGPMVIRIDDLYGTPQCGATLNIPPSDEFNLQQHKKSDSCLKKVAPKVPTAVETPKTTCNLCGTLLLILPSDLFNLRRHQESTSCSKNVAPIGAEPTTTCNLCGTLLQIPTSDLHNLKQHQASPACRDARPSGRSITDFFSKNPGPILSPDVGETDASGKGYSGEDLSGGPVRQMGRMPDKGGASAPAGSPFASSGDGAAAVQTPGQAGKAPVEEKTWWQEMALLQCNRWDKLERPLLKEDVKNWMTVLAGIMVVVNVFGNLAKAPTQPPGAPAVAAGGARPSPKRR
eukprot:gene6928-30910_t